MKAIKIISVVVVSAAILISLLHYMILEPYQQYKTEEHDVILVLVSENEAKETILTSWEEGAEILNPGDYKIFDSLISGYVVVDDQYYIDDKMTSIANFPMKMPNADLKIYAKVRPLTNISSLSFAEPDTVNAYFSSVTSLKDYYNNLSNENDTSYYELKETTMGNIQNIIQYYPAKETIMLYRSYALSENIPNVLYIQDEFGMSIQIDLKNKTVIFNGKYTRMGMAGSIANPSAGGGSIAITYNIDSLAIDGDNPPLPPNFDTITYSSSVIYADNIVKFKELWDSDGYEYAKTCYKQIDSLLRSLSKHIKIFDK